MSGVLRLDSRYFFQISKSSQHDKLQTQPIYRKNNKFQSYREATRYHGHSQNSEKERAQAHARQKMRRGPERGEGDPPKCRDQLQNKEGCKCD